MPVTNFQKTLEAITSLGDPVRRKLYEAAATAEEPVSRKELAKMTGVARPLAAYHLDRLVKEGLLETRFERQSGRVGPGAGRPAKLYFRPRRSLSMTLPPRDVEIASRLLLQAVAQRNDPETLQLIDKLARQAGAGLVPERQGDEADLDVMKQLLTERGYEPRTDAGGTTWLKNCIFDELAVEERQIICPMNLGLIKGMLERLPNINLEACLEPGEGRCCVILQSAASA